MAACCNFRSPSPGPSWPRVSPSLAQVPRLVLGEPAWRPQGKGKGRRASRRAGSAPCRHAASLYSCEPRRWDERQAMPDSHPGLHVYGRCGQKGSHPGTELSVYKCGSGRSSWLGAQTGGRGARDKQMDGGSNAFRGQRFGYPPGLEATMRCKFGRRPHPHPPPPPLHTLLPSLPPPPHQNPFSSNL